MARNDDVRGVQNDNGGIKDGCNDTLPQEKPMRSKVKIPAKINLTLDIVGAENGFHKLKSLVTSANIFDVVTLLKRKDDKISVKFTGLSAGVPEEASHAKKAALAFTGSFSVRGADITIKRNIPAGGGLGGSSADVAGVLLGMKKLYLREIIARTGLTEREIDGKIEKIANSLGSDTAYMLRGGYAVLSGRGEIIDRCLAELKLYFLIIAGTDGVSSAAAYKKYDEIGKKYPPHTTEAARAYFAGETKELAELLKNDLYPAASEILPEIGKTLGKLEKFGAASMTGSGSAVFGLYENKKERDFAYKILKREYGKRLIKAETI